MQKRQSNRVLYSEEQAYTTDKYVIPYVSEFITIDTDFSVLEIGCGECGNMRPFMDKSCFVTGVDISEHKIITAEKIYKNHKNKDKLSLFYKDIYNLSFSDIGKFDLIFMRDVIEHIPNQKVFLQHIKQFLKPTGKIFFGFPPWQMPFGGHQQGCKSKIGSALPYYHLLPNPLYKGLLKLFGESEGKIKGLLNTKSTGISIERFESFLKYNNYKIDKKTTYLINPNYEIKFNLKPRKQFSLLASIPYLRNYLSTCVYYIVSNK